LTHFATHVAAALAAVVAVATAFVVVGFWSITYCVGPFFILICKFESLCIRQ